MSPRAPLSPRRYCNQKAWWSNNKYCQHSCYGIGLGYEGDLCCEAASPPPPLSTFALIDADGDGCISEEEWDAGQHHLA